MFVGSHHLFNCGKYLLLLYSHGESAGQQQCLLFCLPNGLNRRAHTRHSRVKFTLTVRFFGKAHCHQQLLQLPVFNRGQVSVGIHR